MQWLIFASIKFKVYWFIVGGHFFTSCMALQAFRSIPIMVCTTPLAFMRRPLSILKKKSSWSCLLKFFTIHILVYKKILVLIWSSFCKDLQIGERTSLSKEEDILFTKNKRNPLCSSYIFFPLFSILFQNYHVNAFCLLFLNNCTCHVCVILSLFLISKLCYWIYWFVVIFVAIFF